MTDGVRVRVSVVELIGFLYKQEIPKAYNLPCTVLDGQTLHSMMCIYYYTYRTHCANVQSVKSVPRPSPSGSELEGPMHARVTASQ